MDINGGILIRLLKILFLSCIVLFSNISCKIDNSVEELLIDTKETDNHSFYGVWQIDNVVLISNMYTGTTIDGDLEENLYEPEDYIGCEIEYSPEFFRLGNEKYYEPIYTITYITVDDFQSGGIFRLPDIYEFLEEENISLENIDKYEDISQVVLSRFDVTFKENVHYEKYSFIPVGTQCVLLNNDTMLIGIWGKILIAYRL